MITKRTLLTTLAIAVVSVTAGFGIDRALATNGSNSTLVQAIAQKFNLNQSDVQAVFDQHRQDQQTQHQERIKTRLDQAVTAGKITTDQETLILNKFQEIASGRAAFMTSLQGMTPTDRKAALETARQDLLDWAKTNTIDPQYLFGGFGGERMGMGHRFGMRQHQTNTQ